MNTSGIYGLANQYLAISLTNNVEISRVRIEISNWLSYKSDCLKSKERERQA